MSSDQISVNEVSSTTDDDGVIILDDDDYSDPGSYQASNNKLMLYNNIFTGPFDTTGNGAKNDLVIVFVIWRGITISKFSFTWYSQMYTLFEYFSNKFEVDIDQLEFKYKNTTIQPGHFFGQINFVKTDFIVGGFKSDVVVYNETEIDNFKILFLYIRYQFEHITMPYIVRVEKSEPLEYSMKLYAEQINVPFNRLRFYLNGFLINGNFTPLHLQMEGGEKIHVTHLTY